MGHTIIQLGQIIKTLFHKTYKLKECVRIYLSFLFVSDMVQPLPVRCCDTAIDFLGMIFK
jgi:hypothetical protein